MSIIGSVNVAHCKTPDGDTTWMKNCTNTQDPITLQPICKVKNLFLHLLPNGNYNAFDAKALITYMEKTGNGTSPLTKVSFSSSELRDLSICAGNDAKYAESVLEFHKWLISKPSNTMAALSEIDTLIAYMDLLVTMSADEKLKEMCMLIIFPNIWLTTCTLYKKWLTGFSPKVSLVISKLKKRLREMNINAIRATTGIFLKDLCEYYKNKESN